VTVNSSIPVDLADSVNAAILSVSEDRLSGFQPDPISEIAARCDLPVGLVIERLRALLEAGTIRRIRQTVQATKLAAGALVAWKVPPEKLDAAFDFMVKQDPFSGHVVLRTTDKDAAGSGYRLWTTLKVPQGYSLEKHCRQLAAWIGAESWRAMPAKNLFVLGVGHLRRRSLEPGARSDEPGAIITTGVERLDEKQWRVLEALKREFSAGELCTDIWAARADEAGMSLEDFISEARALETRGLMGRFSTFLEHVKPLSTGERVTRYNALFHWQVPEGREVEAGIEIARHHVLTHAYWREGGPEFGNVNVMAVAHGLEKDVVMQHKAAIDAHLAELGIPVGYTNVFWGGRSEIKPSEVMPSAYREWCVSMGLDPEAFRDLESGVPPA
jgi:DNA-binding Lrp family transcriptional regulator